MKATDVDKYAATYGTVSIEITNTNNISMIYIPFPYPSIFQSNFGFDAEIKHEIKM